MRKADLADTSLFDIVHESKHGILHRQQDFLHPITKYWIP